MPLRSFTILLDNLSMTYAPGELVSGKVVIQTKREVSTKSVQLKFEGKASVKWSETRTIGTGDNTKTHTENYKSEQIFFDFDTYLLGNGQNDVIIPSGDSFYPFSFRLPKILPSNFERAHGRVEYVLSAKVQRSWGFDNKTKQMISIKPILDLNQYSEASQPATWTKSKTFGFLWWKSAPLTMNVNLKKIGYCPGEILSVEVAIKNSSQKLMTNLSAALTQTVEYMARGKSKCKTTTLLTVQRGKNVSVGKNDIWIPEIEVPNVVPTNLGGCRIIGVSYAVTITAHVSGAALNLSHDCPIIIGTEPLRV